MILNKEHKNYLSEFMNSSKNDNFNIFRNWNYSLDLSYFGYEITKNIFVPSEFDNNLVINSILKTVMFPIGCFRYLKNIKFESPGNDVLNDGFYEIDMFLEIYKFDDEDVFDFDGDTKTGCSNLDFILDLQNYFPKFTKKKYEKNIQRILNN